MLAKRVAAFLAAKKINQFITGSFCRPPRKPANFSANGKDVKAPILWRSLWNAAVRDCSRRARLYGLESSSLLRHGAFFDSFCQQRTWGAEYRCVQKAELHLSFLQPTGGAHASSTNGRGSGKGGRGTDSTGPRLSLSWPIGQGCLACLPL